MQMDEARKALALAEETGGKSGLNCIVELNHTVILYGKDEYRLYEAALAIEREMKSLAGG